MTRCQILCSMRLQCVSKILTPLRMLKKTSLIAKINSFQNMCDMLLVKLDRFATKTFFSKQTQKNSFFGGTQFRGFLNLGGAVCKTIGTPLKCLG